MVQGLTQNKKFTILLLETMSERRTKSKDSKKARKEKK